MDDKGAQIYNLEKYLRTESGRLADADPVEAEEIFAECDEVLDTLISMGHYPVAQVVDLNANVVEIRPPDGAA